MTLLNHKNGMLISLNKHILYQFHPIRVKSSYIVVTIATLQITKELQMSFSTNLSIDYIWFVVTFVYKRGSINYILNFNFD